MNHPDACLFCAIATNESPAEKLYEDAHTVAFLDIMPSSEGHTLIIPKMHARDLLDIEPDSLVAVHRTVRLLARAIDAALGPDGLRVAQLNRAAAGQTIFHYHVHIMPAQAGAGLRVHGRNRAAPADLRQVAGRIRRALQSMG
jgi:histidine triad (HIT) family protein